MMLDTTVSTRAISLVRLAAAAWMPPRIPTQMRAVDDCGDGLHPSDSGYCKMGDAIDLALFD
jgi:lysophospholipase L1-like esterase